jgi:hypothetical protein
MKRPQDCECGRPGADPLGQGDAVLDSLSGGSDPSIGIRMLVYIILSVVTIFATFKRPGRPRAFVVFKDESRD